MKIAIIAKSYYIHNYLLCLHFILRIKIDVIYALKENINLMDIGAYRFRVIALDSLEECVNNSDLIIAHERDILTNALNKIILFSKNSGKQIILIKSNWDDGFITNLNGHLDSLDARDAAIPNFFLISIGRLSLPFAGELLVYNTIISLGRKVKSYFDYGALEWLNSSFNDTLLNSSFVLSQHDGFSSYDTLFNHININSNSDLMQLDKFVQYSKPDFVIVLTNSSELDRTKALCEKIKCLLSTDVDFVISSIYSSIIVGKNTYSFYNNNRTSQSLLGSFNYMYIDDGNLQKELSKKIITKLAYPDGIIHIE